MPKHRPYLCSVLLLLVSAGCLGPVPTFEGDHAPKEVAVVEMGTLGRILEIDEQDWDGKSFQVLPGEHHLRFFVQLRGEEVHEFIHQRANIECQASLQARAGHTYRIIRTPIEYGDSIDRVDQFTQRFGFAILVVDAADATQVVPGRGCFSQ